MQEEGENICGAEWRNGQMTNFKEAIYYVEGKQLT